MGLSRAGKISAATTHLIDVSLIASPRQEVDRHTVDRSLQNSRLCRCQLNTTGGNQEGGCGDIQIPYSITIAIAPEPAAWTEAEGVPRVVSATVVKIAMYKSVREHAEAEISQGIRRPLRSI
jgi:hypothetical protein